MGDVKKLPWCVGFAINADNVLERMSCRNMGLSLEPTLSEHQYDQLFRAICTIDNVGRVKRDSESKRSGAALGRKARDSMQELGLKAIVAEEATQNLASAGSRKDWESVKKLMAKKANPNVACNRIGDTVLHMAAEIGNTEVVRWLLEEGADREARNSYGVTPL